MKKSGRKALKRDFCSGRDKGFPFKTRLFGVNEGVVTNQGCRASLNHFSFSVAFLAFGRTALIFFFRTILLFQDLGSLGQNARSLTGASRLQEKEMK
ncbi:MAG: hypothetical protein KBT28_09920 [Bacteroidales bacterium]|nr:hypothetical protein [Candidatus Colimorpha merdihippi]